MKLLLSFLLLIYTFEIHGLEKYSLPQGSDLAYWIAIKKAKAQEGLKPPKTLFNINSNNSLLDVVCLEKYGCQGDTKNWELKGLFKTNVRVKMVSLISDSNKSFDPYLNRTQPYNSGKKDMWVTAFPQVRNFCKTIKGDKKNRLERYLGLPLNTSKSRFVELYVRPVDLFRPCRDKEIHDNFCTHQFGPNTTPEFKQWIENTYALSFPEKGVGVPWTRMGYTYDWGNIINPIGASEYIVRPNSEVFVLSITPLEEYCR